MNKKYESFIQKRNAKKYSSQLHVHTQYSLKDSVVSIKNLLEMAKELGIKVLSLTDHGTMLGIEEFMSLSKEYDVKTIPGVEAYVGEDRRHLVLLSKDLEGYNSISKCVSKSNEHIQTINKLVFPCMNKEILKQNIKKGHVIGLSACMNGVLAKIILQNKYYQDSIDKLQKRADKISGKYDSFLKYKKELDELEARKSSLTEEKKTCQALSKKSLLKEERALKKLEGEELINAEKELENKRQEKENATNRLVTLQEELNDVMKAVSFVKAQVKANESSVKYEEYIEQINEIKSKMRSEEDIYEETKAELMEFIDIFGEGNFYIELQYHGIPEEAKVFEILAKLAKETKTPVVATNDVHMLTNHPDDIKARQLIRCLRFNKWEELFTGDDQLYLKSDEELKEALLEILPEDIVNEAISNMDKIGEMCNVSFKQESHYPVFSENSKDLIREKAYDGMMKKYHNIQDLDEIIERTEYELEVICSMGYADYLLIVQDFLEIGRQIGFLSKDNFKYLEKNIYEMSYEEMLDYINKYAVDNGEVIGPGRGSAAGSIVCYELGITNVDPLKYDLLFERFLNVERVSMPDIDSDIATDVRPLVIEYVRKKYGYEAVCSICTIGTMAAKSSIRNVARIMGFKESVGLKADEVDAIAKKYLAIGDRIAKEVPAVPGVKLGDCVDVLLQKFNSDTEKEIIKSALLVENTAINTGSHAAGVIISDNKDVSDYVPLMWDVENQLWKCQCDMVQAETRGLLKMDFLGLRNLHIITNTLRSIEKRTGVRINIDEIPFEEEVFKEIYAKGNTNAIFQFESGGMKSMLRQFQPSDIHDVILLNAAYRPGPMDFIPDIISVKRGITKPDYVIPEMDSILGSTYGYPVYQEQIMQICNQFAGFSLGESDIIRRYMSKKKVDKFMAYQPKFIDGLVKMGADRAKAEEFWDALVNFSRYAFNKSHAAAYSIVSYQTAWLKYHFPADFMCAAMELTPLEKIPALIEDCKQMGVNVSVPSINEAETEFSIKNINGKDTIIFGLSSVKFANESTGKITEYRESNGKFKDFRDIIKLKIKKNVMNSLIQAGAFDEFCGNRQSLKAFYSEAAEIYEKIADRYESLARNQKIMQILDMPEDIALNELVKMGLSGKRVPSKKTYQNNIDKNLDEIKTLEDKFNNLPYDLSFSEDKKERLAQEKDVIGMYISAHPLDEYKSNSKYTNIDALSVGKNIKIMGIITNVRLTQRKADGKAMAFFTLEDKTGTISCCCFTRTYEEFHSFVKEDEIVILTGSCVEEEFNDEVIQKFHIQKIEGAQALKKESVILHFNSKEEFEKCEEIIKLYEEENGFPLIVHYRKNNCINKTNYIVSKDIENETFSFVLK